MMNPILYTSKKIDDKCSLGYCMFYLKVDETDSV